MGESINKPEQYWSGGLDRNPRDSVDVLVDGKKIWIGVELWEEKALTSISIADAEKIIHMLNSAINHAREWDDYENKQGKYKLNVIPNPEVIDPDSSNSEIY